MHLHGVLMAAVFANTSCCCNPCTGPVKVAAHLIIIYRLVFARIGPGQQASSGNEAVHPGPVGANTRR
jgi:hypothetical protein